MIMKRIIQNISLCVLLALVMGACEEDATLVNPDVVHGKSTVAKEEVAETAFCGAPRHRKMVLLSMII